MHNNLVNIASVPDFALSHQMIGYAFDAKTRERGRQYYQTGRIIPSTITVTDVDVTANVIGSKQNIYEVRIAFEKAPNSNTTLVLSECSCPVAFNCKHAAALSYFVVENRLQLRNYSENKLPAPLHRWLKSVETIKAGGLAPTKSPDNALLYLLESPTWHERPRLYVRPVLAKKMKNGTWGANRKGLDFYRILNNNHAAASDEDVSIAALFLSISSFRSFSNEEPPRDPGVASLVLQRIIKTGRAYWKSVQNPPLVFGEQRNGEIEWIFENNGRQTPTLRADGGAVALLSSHLWYVDEKTWESGPLATPYSNDVLETVLNAPPIPPEHVETVSSALDRLTNVALPKPKKIEAKEVKVICPTPCLTVMPLHQAFEQHTWTAELAIRMFEYVAMLTFDYGCHDFPPGSSELQIVENGTLKIYKRDTDFEEESIDWLKENGLQEAGRARTGEIAFVQEGGDFKNQQWWLNWAYRNGEDLVDAEWVFRKPWSGGGWRGRSLRDDDTRQKRRKSDKVEIRLTKNNNWWFNLDLGIEVDGERLSIFPILLAAIRSLGRNPVEAIEANSVDGEFVVALPDGSLLGLPVERVKIIAETLFETIQSSLKIGDEPKVSIGQALALSAAPDANVNWLSDKLKELAKRVNSGDAKLQLIDPPKHLKATLRPYQLQGVSWLQFLAEYGLGGILADDMGLGKTIQSLAHILLEKQNNSLEHPCLIVCPVSVLPNWKAEAARFAPSLKVIAFHGADRHELVSRLQSSDIVLTTYPLLVRDYDMLATNRKWHMVILDEAQAIKNPSTKLAKAACGLDANHRICLTGTPVENNLGELWSQFQFLMPGALGTSKDFANVFRAPIEKYGDLNVQKALNQRTLPFMLRRTKNEVASELPEKTEIIRSIELGEGQRDFYETVRVAMNRRVLDEVANNGIKRSLLIILDAMLKLRQACCDPSLVKLDAAKKITSSAKLETLLEMLTELSAEGRKTLVFSQFTSMLDIIAERLKELNIDFVQLRGSTIDRVTPVRKFQSGDVPVFLISLKAGGTGLNLTAADTVIHYDPWWNPAVENQATDRAHRIGQDKNVFVYKLICTNTIEDRVIQLQDKKRRIADAAFAGCATGETMPFDEDTLKMLLGS